MNSSEFERLSKRAEQEKEQFEDNLLRILSKAAPGKLGRSDVNELHKIGSAYFSSFEKFLAKCSDSGLTKVQASDVAVSATNVLYAAMEFWNTLERVASVHEMNPRPLASFMATTQSVLRAHHPETARTLKALYEKSRLPVGGFMDKPLNLKEQKTDWPMVLSGLGLIFFAAVLAFFLKVEDGVQFLVTRVVLSVGAGLVLSGFTKNQIKVTYRFKGTLITAAGAAGTFLVIYLINPPRPPDYSPPAPPSMDMRQESSGATTQ